MAKKQPKNIDEQVAQYTKIRPKYESFSGKLEELLKDLLSAHPVKYHIVESRAKSIDSFREKITRPGKSYHDPLKELTDLAGIRVIVYYTDDVDTVASMLKKEFRVYGAKSSDKRDTHDADQFGYLSVHRILSLKTPRTYLAEWKPFVKLQFEVQIRTVLQHSWAAISHAMQYKQEADVPVELKRKLFRLAGLFELADEQFVDIRDEHADITETVARQFDKASKGIPIDSVSIKQFADRSKYVKKAEKAAISAGWVQVSAGAAQRIEAIYIPRVVRECNRLNLRTIDELETAISRLGGSHEQYFAELKGGWGVSMASKSFVLYLIMIAVFQHQFTETHLVEVGYNAGFAKAVLDAAAAIE